MAVSQTLVPPLSYRKTSLPKREGNSTVARMGAFRCRRGRPNCIGAPRSAEQSANPQIDPGRQPPLAPRITRIPPDGLLSYHAVGGASSSVRVVARGSTQRVQEAYLSIHRLCIFGAAVPLLPFRVKYFSGSRAPAWFMVEAGVAMKKASNSVPVLLRNPCAARWRLNLQRGIRRGCRYATTWQKRRIVVSSGMRSNLTPVN